MINKVLLGKKNKTYFCSGPIKDHSQNMSIQCTKLGICTFGKGLSKKHPYKVWSLVHVPVGLRVSEEKITWGALCKLLTDQHNTNANTCISCKLMYILATVLTF